MRHAAHHLVAAMGDAGEAVQQRQRLGGGDAGGEPDQAEPVTAAAAAAKKAAISILPSRPMSMMPLRSENSPPMAHRTSGVATRSVAASSRGRRAIQQASSITAARDARSRRAALQPGPRQVLQRAGEQDHQALDHHDHLAGDGRDLEGELGAALVQRAEQQRRQHDADRMVAAHQRHGDAGEAVARREVEHDAMVHAHQLVDADEARPARRERHMARMVMRAQAGCRHRPRPRDCGPWRAARSPSGVCQRNTQTPTQHSERQRRARG